MYYLAFEKPIEDLMIKLEKAKELASDGAVDVKKTDNKWAVFSHGGTKKTNLEAIDWMKRLEAIGAGEILLTSMDKDGTKDGFDLELLKEASKQLTIPIIASGGVGELKHFKEGVIIGNANALLQHQFSILENLV